MNIEIGHYIIVFLILLFSIGSLCLLLDKPQKILVKKTQNKKSVYAEYNNYDVIINEEDNEFGSL